jgi:hypothetical protein
MIHEMNQADIWNVAAAVITAVGGGGAIVFGLSGYLGKVWADRGLAKQKQEYAQLNIAFTNQVEIATRRLQIELDAVGHLRKLTIESEFEKLNALWKSLAAVEITFGTLPRADMTLGNFTDEQKQKYCFDLSMNFSTCANEARTVWRQEALSIPPHIEKETAAILLVANKEQMSTLDHTYPLDSASFSNSEAQKRFFDSRAARYEEFLTKMNELKDMIRKHLKSTSATESQSKKQ